MEHFRQLCAREDETGRAHRQAHDALIAALRIEAGRCGVDFPVALPGICVEAHLGDRWFIDDRNCVFYSPFDDGLDARDWYEEALDEGVTDAVLRLSEVTVVFVQGDGMFLLPTAKQLDPPPQLHYHRP